MLDSSPVFIEGFPSETGWKSGFHRVGIFISVVRGICKTYIAKRAITVGNGYKLTIVTFVVTDICK